MPPIRTLANKLCVPSATQSAVCDLSTLSAPYGKIHIAAKRVGSNNSGQDGHRTNAVYVLPKDSCDVREW